MKNQKSIGLDELMIVNPGQPGAQELSSADFFLGEDGALYQVQGAQGQENGAGLTGFFLGDDGRLYQLHGLDTLVPPDESTAGLAGAQRLPRFFLGEDGTLYEMKIDSTSKQGGL
jgi:hypothetical protein